MTTRFRLTLDIVVDLDGDDALNQINRLYALVDLAMGRGDVTGSGPATVVEHNTHVEVIEESA